MQDIYAQCTTIIKTFPYSEDFENSDGNWLPGGYFSDWIWGIPQKPIINSAGLGKKCWIIGGLTEASYSNGENSWLQSPCFDISSLDKPEISFKVFWQTERKYDGASFQYSIDGGNNWITLGSDNSNTNCSGINWFNYSSINYLGGSTGWSGNINPTSGSCQGGGGSNGWLNAKHSLAEIAGKQSVIFRFTFGAGTQCNDFDGFAIDDIKIGETPAGSEGFSYSCNAGRSISFNSLSSSCQPTYIWNFGDPASSEKNTSEMENPIHIFSSPGTYTVSLIKSSTSSSPITITTNIIILDVTTSVTNSIKCNEDFTGVVTAKATGGSGAYKYTWNTNPLQNTATINNLSAGTYTVSVEAANACKTSSSVTLAKPLDIRVDASTADAFCGKNNGTISTVINGGSAPYKFSWSSGQNTSTISNLAAGNYSVSVTDAKGCKADADNIEVRNIINMVKPNLGNDTTICPGDKLILDPGNFSGYQWQDHSTLRNFVVKQTGIYTVKVSDDSGCNGYDTISVTVDCSDVFFPSAFTPDNNGLNDLFGPLGNITSLKNYKITIYGRWGEILFSSTDPYKKWDGNYKGQPMDSGIVTWFSTYKLNGKQQSKKGMVTLIR